MSLLSITMFTPLTAATIMVLFLRGEDEAAQRNVKILALVATTATFLISLFVLFGFEPSDTRFQFVEEHEWLLGLKYKLGVDGISVLFVMLTTFLMPITVLACWNVEHRVKEFMAAFLVLETFMIGVFCSLDIVLFYLFFESGLIPMFLIIGVWGGKDRIYVQVLPLYAARLNPHADGDDRIVDRCRHLRYRRLAGAFDLAGDS